jgi:hypothetical protein
MPVNQASTGLVGNSDDRWTAGGARRTAPVAEALAAFGVGPMVRASLAATIILLLACSQGDAGCADPSTLVHSAVGITRHFDEQEMKAESGALGVRGTGWFLSPQMMLTVAHVAEGMHLSRDDWKDVEIRDGEARQSIPVRLMRLFGSRSEKIAVLELKDPFATGRILQIRTEPLERDEPVVSFGYPGNRLRFAEGRFVQYGADDDFPGFALLELYDGNDRLAVDYGASGAPVLDCNGRVVAVVSNVLTQTIEIPSRAIRISTAWQMPNVISGPVQEIKD